MQAAFLQSTVQEQQPDTCKAAANAPKGLAATNRAFRNNSDPNTWFTVDASQLTVKQLRDFNSAASAPGVVQGSGWLVHGAVTLRQGANGSISIAPERYDFEQHDVASFRELVRNFETYGGYVATFGGLSEYWADLTGGNHATDFSFDFACQPRVVR